MEEYKREWDELNTEWGNRFWQVFDQNLEAELAGAYRSQK